MLKDPFDSRDIRQGNQRLNVLYVLAAGLVLAVVAMTVVNLFGDIF
ncbi:hypothetical protein FP2506_06241 [Fulvimarina pelagi HTCC2506]|uniref:Uncharacterized protein n=1 Tax=Fulvimarina pelagi HTCC2506 TaxID=314231 RepID=Q0G7E8_9HYPH|nr:hypothetical protein [Fulvimarina pelagi]EAU42416.1 hypothetical protein FP2506_06241 [Fulvimarina pelagi HTCC2506]